MCNFDSGGEAVLADGAQTYKKTVGSGEIQDLARSLGVSTTIIYAAIFLFLFAVMYLTFSMLCGKKKARRQNDPDKHEYDSSDEVN